jgi:hypothetical protein
VVWCGVVWCGVVWCGVGTGKKVYKNRKLGDVIIHEEDDGEGAAAAPGGVCLTCNRISCIAPIVHTSLLVEEPALKSQRQKVNPSIRASRDRAS